MLEIHRGHSLYLVLAEIAKQIDANFEEQSRIDELVFNATTNADYDTLQACLDALQLEELNLRSLPGNAFLCGVGEHNELLIQVDDENAWRDAIAEAKALKQARSEQSYKDRISKQQGLFTLQARAHLRAA